MILAIDQGTTGTTCLVFDERGAARAAAPTASSRSTSRSPGWVEHDAAEIWEVTRGGRARGARGGRRRARATSTAIGITNQRETVVAWDERTGEPLHHAIVWQDRRTAARCDELRERGPRGARARAHRARDRPLLLGHEDRVAAARTSTGSRDAARSGERALRHDRRLACLQADRPRGDRLLERVAHDAVRHPQAALGRRAVRAARRAGRRRCPRCVRSARACSARPTRTRSSAPRCPLAGIAGDQQAALFGQACHRRRASARTPTAPAASCC